MAFSSDSAEPRLTGVRRWWLILCAAVGVALVVSQLAEIPYRSALRGYDNTFNYLWLRSAMVDHDWDFRNDIVECDTFLPEYRASALTLPVTSTGHVPNKYGVGWAVLTVPFYLIADAIVGLGRVLGIWSLHRDGFNPVYQVCIQLGHVGVAALALWLAVQTVSGWVGNRACAMHAVIGVWAASPLLYYQTANVSMSHGAGFFAVAVMCYGLMRAKVRPDSVWPWWLAGAGWGLAVTTRFQLGLFGVMAVWTVFSSPRPARGIIRAIALLAIGALPFVAIQLWGWHVVYGKWLVFGYGGEGEGFHWGTPALLRSLFSPWHGLLYWHPFLAVAAAGLAGWAWSVRREGIALAAVFAATLYVNAAWWCWWFASSFGSRSIDAAVLPLMGGTAWLFGRATEKWRTLLNVLLVSACLWNFYLVLLYRTGAISRSDPVTWSEMLHAAAQIGARLKF
jgi:hypothetical protein